MKKRFLRYQFALRGTSESDATEDFKTQVETNLFANNDYGVEGVGVSSDGEIVIYGEIRMATKQECKALYTLLKASAKSIVPQCKKTTDLLVGTGDILW